MPEKPYENGECYHRHTLIVRGECRCQQCGMVYNETTLTWEKKEDE